MGSKIFPKNVAHIRHHRHWKCADARVLLQTMNCAITVVHLDAPEIVRPDAPIIQPL